MQKIFINQVGYLPQAKKIAVFLDNSQFQVIDKLSGNTVYEGNTVKFSDIPDEASGDIVYHGDFSSVIEAGEYFIKTADGVTSPSFKISSNVYNDVKNAMIKALYFQRCGVALTEKYAGVYTHEACHTGKSRIWGEEPVDGKYTELDMTGGWHDAGDYGRYSTPAAVALAHLLYAYEMVPEVLQDELNIPETGNGVPDILNECRFEIDWLLKMQKDDGSVYHKLTAFSHADFIMPECDKDQFYLFEPSSMATADFAAIMCVVSRVYKKYDKELSERAWNAAKKAYEYLTVHPEYVGFYNPQGSNTGEYGDDCDTDERIWAAAEMLRMDKYASEEQKAAYKAILLSGLDELDDKTDMGWTNVAGLAGIAVFLGKAEISEDVFGIEKDIFVKKADRLVLVGLKNAYQNTLKETEYEWGSNMVFLNQAMILCMSHYLTGKEEYLEAALENFNYILGKNALGVSYITGYGDNAFKNPHNRPTAVDGIEDPMPGWVSGGANREPCDEKAVSVIPKGTPAMKCYVDAVEAYSVNEITIYWNSPAVFVASYFLSI